MKKTMRQLIYGILPLCALLAAYACSKEKETEGTSKSALLCTLTLKGKASVSNPLGVAYVDSGYVAKEGETDVTANVRVDGTVDHTKPGVYVLTYSITNKDGFVTSKKRTVVVPDLTAFEGDYFGEVTWRTYHYTDAPIKITNLGYGFYELDDLHGGLFFYGIYDGYEPDYDFHCEAVLTLTGNTINLISLGDSYYTSRVVPSSFTGTFDTTTGRIEIEFYQWGTEVCSVTLTK